MRRGRDPGRRGEDYFDNLVATKRQHKFGAAVEVKEPGFYTDPNTQLFLSEDGIVSANRFALGYKTERLGTLGSV